MDTGAPRMDEAMTELAEAYRTHGPALLTYLRRRAGRHAPAEDLLQETLMHAARRPERLTQAVSARAWLFAIARNVAATALRRSRPTVAIPENLIEPARYTDQRLADMRTAIEALPEHQREALELRLRDDLSYEEIAAVLSIPVGTVRSRLHHAVRRLRETLTPATPHGT